MSGNNVSHANNKRRRVFEINKQSISFISRILGRCIRFPITAHGLRTIEHNGGFDAFLQKTSVRQLAPELARLKKEFDKKIKGKPPTFF